LILQRIRGFVAQCAIHVLLAYLLTLLGAQYVLPTILVFDHKPFSVKFYL